MKYKCILMNSIDIDNFRKSYGYTYDPTHTYLYKKISDDIEVNIQVIPDEFYSYKQVIIHCLNGCILEYPWELIRLGHFVYLVPDEGEEDE